MCVPPTRSNPDPLFPERTAVIFLTFSHLNLEVHEYLVRLLLIKLQIFNISFLFLLCILFVVSHIQILRMLSPCFSIRYFHNLFTNCWRIHVCSSLYSDSLCERNCFIFLDLDQSFSVVHASVIALYDILNTMVDNVVINVISFRPKMHEWYSVKFGTRPASQFSTKALKSETVTNSQKLEFLNFNH